MLKFEVSINGTPALNCSLAKQVKWVISDAHGKGAITNGGRTMKGEGRQGEYCWRVGGCYFDSGVHTWKVQFHNHGSYSYDGYDYYDDYEDYGDYHCSAIAGEVGIIDYDEINADIAQSEKKWIHNYSVRRGHSDDISLTLDMEKKTLNVMVNSGCYGSCANNYLFTARRVSPFFACDSPGVRISLVE
jgi:hypothetical protein